MGLSFKPCRFIQKLLDILNTLNSMLFLMTKERKQRLQETPVGQSTVG